VVFPLTDGRANDRDLVLAWQALSDSGVGVALCEEEKYLKRALKQFPDDPALLSALGFLYQRQHKLELARSLEECAVQKDPLDNVAATDLGVIAAQTGNLQEAERLWRQAFEREPGSSAIGLNLSKALYTEGKRDQAREAVERVPEFNPDLPEAKMLLQEVNRAQH
jgi:Flp pilus assembly protein TadD